MEFHSQKCSVLLIIRSLSPQINKYQLHGHTLNTETDRKFPGILALAVQEQILPLASFVENFKQLSNKSKQMSAKRMGSLYWRKRTQTNQNWCRDGLPDMCVTITPRWQAYYRYAAETRMSHPTTKTCRHPSCVPVKCSINGLVAVDLSDQLARQIRPSRHCNSYNHILVETKAYVQKSFLPLTLNQWNRLLESIVQSASLDAFKEGVSDITHLFPTLSYLSLYFNLLHITNNMQPLSSFLSLFYPLFLYSLAHLFPPPPSPQMRAHTPHRRQKLTLVHLFADLFRKEIFLTLQNKCKVFCITM